MVDNHKQIDQLLQSVWHRRDQGMPVSITALQRPITSGDVAYLVSRYPFLQLVNSDPLLTQVTDANFMTAGSGWVIHDYGVALSVSPGQHALRTSRPLYNGQDEEEAGGEGASEFIPGQGTIIKLTVDTAAEMIAIAIGKGWPGVEVVDGSYLMKWAAWMAAEDQEFSLTGFEPNEKDRAKRQRIRRITGLVTRTPTTTPSLGGGFKRS